jgi:hypothetical protein
VHLCTHKMYLVTMVGLARTGVYTVILAGRSPNIRSYTVHIYGSGHTIGKKIKCCGVMVHLCHTSGL